MEHSPLDKLLERALQSMAADFPDIKRQLDAFMAAAEHLHERDKSGNLTRRAHDARSLLRSALLDMRPYLRAKSAVDKARRKSKFKAETAISTALVEWVKWRQHELEYDLLLDKDDAAKAVPKSREVSDREDKIRVTEKFIDELLERGVTPSDVSRKRQFELDVLASLLKWTQDDPKLEIPDNPWTKMSAAGMLDAYRDGMTDDEAKIVDLARVLKNERGVELLRVAREFLPQSLDVSPGFAAAAAQMFEQSRELTPGEAHAYYHALRRNVDKDIDALGEALGITEPEDIVRIKALNHFLSSYEREPARDIPIWLQVTTVKKVVDSSDPASRAPSDWVPEFASQMTELAQAFSESWDNASAFHAIMSAGVQMSAIGANHTRISDEQERMRERISDLEYVEVLVITGMAFKFDGDGCPIGEDDPRFAEHPGKIYRAESIPRPIDNEGFDAHTSKGVADLPGVKAATSPPPDRTTDYVGLAPKSSGDAADADGDIYESPDLSPSTPRAIDVAGIDVGGADNEASGFEADLFGDHQTSDPGNSVGNSTSAKPGLAPDHLMNAGTAAEQEEPHAQELAQILPADAPPIDGLQMARRRAGIAGSAEGSASPAANPKRLNPPKADQERATDMDDEDF